MRIAVAGLKGGVGKSTSSMYLATAAIRTGRRVVVLDADPQQSAVRWSVIAGEGLGFDVIGVPSRSVARHAVRASGEVDVTIMDCPPGAGDTPITRAAVGAATTVIVPLAPSLGELDRLGPTLSLIDQANGAPGRVLVVRARRRSRSLGEVLEALDARGIARFETVIPDRQAVIDAFGSAPKDLHGYDSVLDELGEHDA